MKFRSIRHKLLFAFLSIGVSVFLLMVTFVPMKAKSTASKVLTDNISFTAKLLTDNLALSMQALEFDNGVSLEQTLSLLQSDVIRSIVIQNAKGTTVKFVGDSIAHLSSEGIVDKNDEVILRKSMTDASGNGLGFVEVAFSKKSFIATINTFTIIIWVVGTILLIAVTLTGLIIANTIVLPIRKSNAMLQDIATGDGDLTRRLTVNSEDEVGEQAQAFNVFIEKLQKMVSQLKKNTTDVTSTSSTVDTVADLTSALAKEISDKASSTTSVMNHVNTSLQNVSESTRSSSEMFLMIARSIEQMSSTIAQVSKECQSEAQVTQSANQLASQTSELVKTLADSATSASKIASVISEISDKTNLLSLNARIESSRAGEAGKGFAVVANEIKDLAVKTRNATVEIRQKLDAMQENSQKSINAISRIIEVIQQIDSISQSIAGAMVEQSGTTKEISSSVTTASNNISHIASQVHSGVQEIVSALETVRSLEESAGKAKQSTQKNKAAVGTLREVMGQLTKMVDGFKI